MTKCKNNTYQRYCNIPVLWIKRHFYLRGTFIHIECMLHERYSHAITLSWNKDGYVFTLHYLFVEQGTVTRHSFLPNKENVEYIRSWSFQ